MDLWIIRKIAKEIALAILYRKNASKSLLGKTFRV